MGFKDFWKKELKKSLEPKIFSMVRNFDESGTSGTGHVLDGVIFPSGKCVVCWDPIATEALVGGHVVNSVSVFDSFEAFCAIHISQHPGNETEVIFLN